MHVKIAKMTLPGGSFLGSLTAADKKKFLPKSRRRRQRPEKFVKFHKI
jgi:hypothetical protein